MGLLDIFQSSKLEPLWSYERESSIWRLLPTERLLVGETRDIEKKQVSFFCLDAETGKPLWQDITFEESWWISIERVHRNVLFMHEFATPDMPDHKRVRALDLSTAKVLWQNDEVQFMFARDEFAYVSKTEFERRVFFELNISTGDVLRQVPAVELSGLQGSIVGNDGAILFPSIDTGSASELYKVQGKIGQSIESSIVKEYISYKDLTVIGYYEQRNSEEHVRIFDQLLVVVDQRGRLVFREIINSGVTFPVPDAFLCMKENLYYIKDKKILVAVTLVV